VLPDVKTEDIEKFQIMFMSMGEPMLNYEELIRAIRILAEKYQNAQLLVSTSAPAGMEKHFSKFIEVSREIPRIGLQFSVHESTDDARAKLIPTKTCTLRQISALGNMWAAFVGRRPFYNYCVHQGNASMEDAQRLAELFNPDVWECTLSVICEKSESVKSSIERQLVLIENFKDLLETHGVSLRVFNPAGQDDIGGGCGQLWYFQEWLKSNKS
jgi:23S rRNA (adenine2503-C2)-methyltransferase